MPNQWRAESIKHDEGDLFVAIVTTLGSKQLIAQCTTLDFAKEIEDKHNRFDVEIGHLKFSLAGARDRAESAEAERDAFAAENDAIHRAVNEMCGTDTSTIEAVQKVIDERDKLRRQLEQAQRENERLHAELVRVNQQNAQALINSIRGDA